MEFLTQLLENNTVPWVTAILLGLMTLISPCPLATNITAVGYISKDIENRHRIFLNGILYTLDRVISYTGVFFILFLGADQLKFSGFLQKYGEQIIGPLLLLIGLIMLGILKVTFPGLGRLNTGMEKKKAWGYWDVILLGMLFAMAFCPYPGVLFSGMLIPLSISTPSGLLLPVLFAVSTAIPVIFIAWLLAYALSVLGSACQKIRIFEIWFRRLISVLFIATGSYYIIKVWFA